MPCQNIPTKKVHNRILIFNITYRSNENVTIEKENECQEVQLEKTNKQNEIKNDETDASYIYCDNPDDTCNQYEKLYLALYEPSSKDPVYDYVI